MKILQIISLLFAFTQAYAIQMQIIGDSVEISGVILVGDNDKMNDLIVGKKINTVKFNDCFGGDASTGYLIGEIIRGKKLNTVAIGTVASACAVSYLAGTNRSYAVATNKNTKIILHGARASSEANKIYESTLNTLLLKYIVTLVPKIDYLVIREAIDIRTPNGGLVFKLTENNMFVDQIHLCSEKPPSFIIKCLKIDTTAREFGVITDVTPYEF